MTYDKIYFPYSSTDTTKKFFIITNQGKKVRFGAKSNDHFTEGHLDEETKVRIDTKKRELGRPKYCWLLICEIPMVSSSYL